MHEPATPEWWLDRLYARLQARRPHIEAWDSWYSGDHPAPVGYEKATKILRRLLETVGANFLGLITDAASERMLVDGFKVGGTINDDLWAIWQGNNFDSASSQVFAEHMALSASYVLVDPNPNVNGFPTLTPEHPAQCITENLPGSLVRAAGLKVWQDDHGAESLLRAVVYLPEQVVGYAAPVKKHADTVSRPAWERQPDLSGTNPLGAVPLVPFLNRPRMLKASRPEFHPVIPIQRRINKTILDRVVMQEYGAFKQKWATGVDIPVDPDTGQPVETYNAAVTRVFVDSDAGAKFGQFEAEDIRQVLAAIEADVKHAAAIVPTPPDYLLGEMVNVSAEGLKAAQASLVSRVRRHMRHDEDPLEDVGRLALQAAGLSVPNVSGMTTVWKNPEYRTEGELVDALLKMATLGVPRTALWERWGASPSEIQAWSAEQAAQASPLTALADALRGTGGSAAGG